MILKQLYELACRVLEVVVQLFRSYATAFPYLFRIGKDHKEVTERYPDPVSSRSEVDLSPRYRGTLYNNIEQCTGCGDCAEVCPAECFVIKTEEGPSSNKKWVSVFDISMDRCVYCGFCTRVCEPESLIHTKDFKLNAFERKGLVLSFGQGEVTPALQEKWKKQRERDEIHFDL